MPDRARLTVGVTTRNRPASLLRCLESLAVLGDLVAEIVVVDDSSSPPVRDALAALSRDVAGKVVVIEQRHDEGYIVGRNSIVRRPANPYVLLLDDDAYLLEGGGVREAVAVMDGHGEIGAIAFGQAGADGQPWPASMQPSTRTYRCRIPAFIGFAHLLRRSTFEEAGGYRESLHFYGEEKHLCARFLQMGAVVLYMPDVLVAHVPDPATRSVTRYVRYVVRNDCLFSAHYDPWPFMVLSLPVRLGRFFSMHRGRPLEDLAGFFWILRELAREYPRALAARRPLRWSELRAWRRLRRQPPAWSRRGEEASRSCNITVGITTRDRHSSLRNCLASLSLIGEFIAEVIVVDDASEAPVAASSVIPPELAGRVRIIRHDDARGNIAGRNAIVVNARTDYVLLSDDDAYFIDGDTVRRGLDVLDADAAVAAVGFAMAAPDGTPWPARMQAAPASYACLIPAYIGFSHLVRRSAFLEVGGYRSLFVRHGEEKECCLRLLDAGYEIVYLPDPPVVHVGDPVGRNTARYLRFVIRNDCLGALFNEPFLMMLVTVPRRLLRYVHMRRAGSVKDRWGLVWIVGELVRLAPRIARERRAVRWATILRWQQLRRESPPYQVALGR